MGKTTWKKVICGILCLSMLTGCQKGISVITEKASGMDYSIAEMKMIAVNERNRYQKVYTDQIWSTAITEEGMTYQDYLSQQVRYFLQNMKTVTLLAKDKGIELTTAEKEEAGKLAESYYSGLSEADLAYIGASKEEVDAMYQEYCLANKAVNELTKDVNLEISDSEAKIIIIDEIKTESEETAQEVLTKLRKAETLQRLQRLIQLIQK